VRRGPHSCPIEMANEVSTRSSSSFVVVLVTARQRVRRTATAGGVGELALDTRQVTLGGHQGVIVLEPVRQLLRVTRQVGLLAGETIPRRLQLAIYGFDVGGRARRRR